MTNTTPYSPPVREKNVEGEEKRVGVELEFTGVDGDVIADLIAECFDGRVEWRGKFEARVETESSGDFKVELDSRWVKEKEPRSEDGYLADIEKWSLDQIDQLAEKIVPWEIVSPPLPVSRLHLLDRLTGMLGWAGARGTRSSAVYAFGLHLNPELSSHDPGTIVDYMRAYTCLHDWLRVHGEVDLSRKVLPFIRSFDKDYCRLILDPGYAPDMNTLIDDYLDHNPTRNRSLDMLPLFSWIDGNRVRAQLDDPLIGSRPTLHYRLPNCDIDQPGWTVRKPWLEWLQVESLAFDEARLAEISTHYLDALTRWFGSAGFEWAGVSERWLDPRYLETQAG